VVPNGEFVDEGEYWEQRGKLYIEFDGHLDHGAELGREGRPVTTEGGLPCLEEGVNGG